MTRGARGQRRRLSRPRSLGDERAGERVSRGALGDDGLLGSLARGALGEQRDLGRLARADLAVQRLACGARGRGGLRDDGRQRGIAAGAIGQPLAQLLELAHRMLELRHASVGVGETLARLALGELGAPCAALGQHERVAARADRRLGGPGTLARIAWLWRVHHRGSYSRVRRLPGPQSAPCWKPSRRASGAARLGQRAPVVALGRERGDRDREADCECGDARLGRLARDRRCISRRAT